MSVGDMNGRWLMLIKALLTVGPVVAAAGITAQGWILYELKGINEQFTDMGNRLTAVETNFNPLEKASLLSTINAQKEQMARIPNELPSVYQVNATAEKANQLEARLNKLEIQHAQLEATAKRK